MSGSEQESTHRTIERVARESYGRLVAYLSSRTRDVGSAEDALGNALVAALETWPRDGVPQNPEAWLLTTARRSFIDLLRHRQVAEASEPTLALLREESKDKTLSPEFPDERLKLLFVCAHPAIDPAMHTPLMLQTVLGLDAARIAHAFLISPTTMGQRLVRAKTKIRDGGIRFEIPQERELPQRLDAVLEAIYAAFGIGWDDMAGVDQRGRDLAEEAIWLARVLLGLMPNEAEVQGLLALMRSPPGGTAGAGRPLRPSLGAGLPEVVSAFNGRGGAASRRSFESRLHGPVSTRSRDSIGTCRAGAGWQGPMERDHDVL
jgi:predicted RNA polymerase sigma factor